MIDQLRAAAEALKENEGNPEPFAALMADNWEWRGVSHSASVEADACLLTARLRRSR